MLRLRYFLLAGLLSAIPFTNGLASENWNLCRVPTFAYVESTGLDNTETKIEAQSIVSDNSEQIHFIGDVSVTRAQQRINADEVIIDKSTQQLDANGNVSFESPSYRLKSTGLQIDQQNERSKFNQAEFELGDRHARGQADQIEKLDNSRSRFSNLFYTSCDPDNSDWHLEAKEMEIDNESGRGSATSTTLYFKEVPFFYLPYFQFPIDDRRMSGLLTPSFGYSETKGGNLVVPIYWNIAENTDATITPVWYSKRGLQLNTENRYLLENHRGQLDLSYLDDDELNDTRWFQQWQHSASFGYDVEVSWLLAEVSDADFFDDFSSIASEHNDTRHLERYVNITRNGDSWQSELLWQDYQTLDASTAIENRPYNRLPRLTLDRQPKYAGDDVEFLFHSEWVDFKRDQSVTGSRTHIVPAISWRSSNSWYYFEPELQLALTDYRLDDNTGDNSIYRSLPTLSVDSGLIFERLAGSQNQWLQTLEPRLYFVHTPFEDQDDIPDFDTSTNSSTFSNLFSNNRFTGADRIGDTSQVTLGISSRLYHNESGDELAHARIGQIFYFKDRRVSLEGSIDESSHSDTIAEVDLWPSSNLKIASRLVYAEATKELTRKDYSINYANQGLAVNLEYYFSDAVLEQALISFVYPINERWTLIAKSQRSLLFDEPVENLFGLNYESCCWGLKMLVGQTGDEIDDFSETDNAIYFELTLKGLSQAGDDIDTRLEDAIPGYIAGF